MRPDLDTALDGLLAAWRHRDDLRRADAPLPARLEALTALEAARTAVWAARDADQRHVLAA